MVGGVLRTRAVRMIGITVITPFSRSLADSSFALNLEGSLANDEMPKRSPPDFLFLFLFPSSSSCHSVTSHTQRRTSQIACHTQLLLNTSPSATAKDDTQSHLPAHQAPWTGLATTRQSQRLWGLGPRGSVNARRTDYSGLPLVSRTSIVLSRLINRGAAEAKKGTSILSQSPSDHDLGHL